MSGLSGSFNTLNGGQLGYSGNGFGAQAAYDPFSGASNFGLSFGNQPTTQFPTAGATPAAGGGGVFGDPYDLFGTAPGVTVHDEGTGNLADISPTGKKIADQTQKMLAEQRAFQLLMAKIKNDDGMRKAFITALRQQATDNKNSFN